MLNINNLIIKNNIFFAYKKVFLFFYFFKKIITISYYNIYLNFLKFSFFKQKNNINGINNLNKETTTTDNWFKDKNKISAEYIKLYSLLIYSKNNWNREVLFCNDEKTNKNISFFFEKYKLQELFGSFNIKKNYQYNLYNYFFFNFFIFFNSNMIENKSYKSKNLIKKLFYYNFKNISNKVFSVFMFSYFKNNFNNLKGIYFISFLNNFLSRNNFLKNYTRFDFFKQKKMFYFYNFLKILKKEKKKFKKKKRKFKKFLNNLSCKKIKIYNCLYGYVNNFPKKKHKIILKKSELIENGTYETNSIFSNIVLDYKDWLFDDFYIHKQFIITPRLVKKLNWIKYDETYDDLKYYILNYKKEMQTIFKYDDDYIFFKKNKNKNVYYLDISFFFEIIILWWLYNIYEFKKFNIWEFLATNDIDFNDSTDLIVKKSLFINKLIFKKKNIKSELSLNKSFFLEYVFKFLFIKKYKPKVFYIKNKISYLQDRLPNLLKDKFFFKNSIEQKKQLMKSFKNRFITDFKIKKDTRRYVSLISFIHRMDRGVSLFFFKKPKKYNKSCIFGTNRYFNIKKQIREKQLNTGFIKNNKINNFSFFKKLKLFKKKYLDLLYNTNGLFIFNMFNLTNFDKKKIINKYKYWYSFFNSWNWAFLFINNFFNYEGKLDYHNLRAKLMYQQNRNYHSNYFFIDNSKTFKDYRFIKEKDRDHFRSNIFYKKVIRKNIFSRKVNSNVYYKEKMYKYKPQYYRRIRAILIKNHHSKTLRRERLRVNYFFKLNYKFQHRLTNWLYYYKLNYGLKLYYNFNLTLVNTLSNSKFIPESVYIIFLLKKQLIFLNGYCVISPKTNLFRGDCISLKINWYVYVYLMYIKKIYNYNNIIIKSFLKNTHHKHKSDNPKNWNYVFQSSVDYDVPYYLEVDYMTLSCIMLFEPDFNYIIKRNFYNLTYVPLLSLFNLNWKYVVFFWNQIYLIYEILIILILKIKIRLKVLL